MTTPQWPVVTPGMATLKNRELERTWGKMGNPQKMPGSMGRPGNRLSSHVRATMAVMDHDAIAAALWSLAGFDPALVHLAELRERFRDLDEEDPIRITLDRLMSVYVEGQCRELLIGAGITTEEASVLVERHIGDPSPVALHVLACTSDPLAMEIFAYALYLGALTAHGTAPWKRFAAVMADCYYEKHPALAVQ